MIIHTGTLGSAPNWSESKYLTLIKKILNDSSIPNLKILLTAREMSRGFLNELKNLGLNHIVDISKSVDNLRDLIKVIGKADLFIGPSTGPLHLADALGKSAIGLHCHRAMNCIIHQGIINKHSINLEVTDENCKKFCSADQNTCGIENGISVDEVLSAIKKLINKKQF